MSDTFKFPRGYDVTVCRKQDIIRCLDENVIDKEVVLALIEQLEVDASNFLLEGRWTGIPFLGNIRIPPTKQKLRSPEVQALIKEARETLDDEKYYVFRRNLSQELLRDTKYERFYKYIVSQFVTRAPELFKLLLHKRGDKEARFIAYTLFEMNVTIEYYA